MSEVARSNSEMLDLVHRRAAAIRRRRRRRIVVSIQAGPCGGARGRDGRRAPSTRRARWWCRAHRRPRQTSVAERSRCRRRRPRCPRRLLRRPPFRRRRSAGRRTDRRHWRPFAIMVSTTSIVPVPLSGIADQDVLRYRCGSTTTPADEVAPHRSATTDDGQFGVSLGCQPDCAFSSDDHRSSTPTSS